jgi:hypothetical protein
VPAAYHADVGTKMVFVFALENPLLAWLRANVPAGAWADLDGFVPYELFCGNRRRRRRSWRRRPSALLLWRRRARARQDAVPEAPRPLPRAGAGRLPRARRARYTFYSPAHWYFNRYLRGSDPVTMIYALAEAAPFFARRAWQARGRIAALAIASACWCSGGASPAALVGSADRRLPGELAQHRRPCRSHARMGAFQAGSTATSAGARS